MSPAEHRLGRRRRALTEAWFAVRWLSWLLGHPLGLSLFAATAMLKLPIGYALGLALIADLGIMVFGFRLSPLGRRRSTQQNEHQASWLGRGLAMRARPERPSKTGLSAGPVVVDPSTGSQTQGADDSGRSSSGWSVDFWGGAVSHRSETRDHDPVSRRRPLDDDCCGSKHRDRRWALGIGFTQYRSPQPRHDYVSTRTDAGEGTAEGRQSWPR